MPLLKKGRALFEIGAAGDGCYWLGEGLLKVTLSSEQGAERIVAILGSGSMVGQSAILDGLPRSASAYALKDSYLIFVPRHMFLACLKESPGLYAYLAGTLAERLRCLDEDIAATSFLSLKARVARALLEFALHLGKPTATPDQVAVRDLRQEDLAARANVARENVSRILSEWRKRKLIIPQTPSIYVILKSRLEREAS